MTPPARREPENRVTAQAGAHPQDGAQGPPRGGAGQARELVSSHGGSGRGRTKCERKPLAGVTAAANQGLPVGPPLPWLSLCSLRPSKPGGQSPRDSRSPRPDAGPARPARLPPGSGPVPDPPRGQPYFPLLLRLFPLLRGGDRALRAWVRFRGLPGPLRAKLLWGSSSLSLKKNHTLG